MASITSIRGLQAPTLAKICATKRSKGTGADVECKKLEKWDGVANVGHVCGDAQPLTEGGPLAQCGDTHGLVAESNASSNPIANNAI
eukprot:15001747-Ditylum_brightwellii.AAC.1